MSLLDAFNEADEFSYIPMPIIYIFNVPMAYCWSAELIDVLIDYLQKKVSASVESKGLKYVLIEKPEHNDVGWRVVFQVQSYAFFYQVFLDVFRNSQKDENPTDFAYAEDPYTVKLTVFGGKIDQVMDKNLVRLSQIAELQEFVATNLNAIVKAFLYTYCPNPLLMTPTKEVRRALEGYIMVFPRINLTGGDMPNGTQLVAIKPLHQHEYQGIAKHTDNAFSTFTFKTR